MSYLAFAVALTVCAAVGLVAGTAMLRRARVSAMAHIDNGAWQREPASHRIVTVGESREPVTSMGGMPVTPEAK